MRRAALLAALTAVLAAGSAGAAAPPAVRLTVRYDDGAGHRRLAHLTCSRAGNRADGFIADAGVRRACAVARRRAGLLLDRRDPRRVCTMIYGGPQTAIVSGRIGARGLRRRFARRDGCEIADWDALRPLLPRVRGAAPAGA